MLSSSANKPRQTSAKLDDLEGLLCGPFGAPGFRNSFEDLSGGVTGAHLREKGTGNTTEPIEPDVNQHSSSSEALKVISLDKQHRIPPRVAFLC